MLSFIQSVRMKIWRCVLCASPENGCIIGGTASPLGPESARGVDQAAEHQLAGDERKQGNENFLRRKHYLPYTSLILA